MVYLLNAIILRYNFSLSDFHFSLFSWREKSLLPTIKAQLEPCIIYNIQPTKSSLCMQVSFSIFFLPFLENSVDTDQWTA